ncbi:MAG TPA: hypothetical protein VFQ70_02430 [Candidatus Saccharimonadaceae bacterium]|nr:hypothetical protein [Candidatus Saccharimonadaceae bacterium]
MTTGERLLRPDAGGGVAELRHGIITVLSEESLFLSMTGCDGLIGTSPKHDKLVAELNEITRQGIASGVLPPDTQEWKDDE